MEIQPITINTILYCRHWLANVQFYRDVLGLQVSHETDWFVEFKITENSFVSIADVDRATIDDCHGSGVTLSWQVDDLGLVRDRLLEKGVAIGPVRKKWGAHVCYFKDPEGYRIELWSC